MKSMSTKNYTLRNLKEIIESIKSLKGIHTDNEVAQLLDIKGKTLATSKSRNSIPFGELFSFCGKEGISFDWLLTGQGPMTREEPKPQSHSTTEDIGLFKEILLTVEEIFDKDNLYLPPVKKVELIFLLYEYIKKGRMKKEEMGGEVIKLANFAKGA
jgi:hypothetical protein